MGVESQSAHVREAQRSVRAVAQQYGVWGGGRGGGREGAREGAREGGSEGGREGRREGERAGGREGGGGEKLRKWRNGEWRMEDGE